MTGLLDIPKEAALRTAFTDVFASLGTREALAPDTLCKRLASADPSTTYSDLRYVRHRYITKEQARRSHRGARR